MVFIDLPISTFSFKYKESSLSYTRCGITTLCWKKNDATLHESFSVEWRHIIGMWDKTSDVEWMTK